MQETYVRLLRHKPVFEGGEHERAWLLRTVINVCHDIQKSAWNKRTVGMEQISGETAFVLPYGIEDGMLPDVLALEEKYRVPIYLFYYEGYSIQEIGEILDIPPNTVKTHLKRGRECLRNELEKR